MEWCCDPREPRAGANLEREILAHLHRHAEDGATLGDAERVIQRLVEDAFEGIRDGAVWASLNWFDVQPTLTVRALGPTAWPGDPLTGPGLEPLAEGIALANEATVELSAAADVGGAWTLRTQLPVARPLEDDIDPRNDALPNIVLPGVAGLPAREQFLAAVATQLAALPNALPGASPEVAAAHVGAALADHIDKMIERGYDASVDARTLVSAFIAWERTVGGDFYLVDANDDRVVLGNRKCPFGAAVTDAPALCRVTSGALGALNARAFGGASVTVDERIALGDPHCRVTIDLAPQAAGPGAPGAAVPVISEPPAGHRYSSPPAGWSSPSESHKSPGRTTNRRDDRPRTSPLHLDLTLCLPRDEVSVPLVRHLCGHALREVGAAPDCVDDVELAVSEACANVLDHSGPGDVYEVTVELVNRECAISVIDKGHGFDFASLPHGLADAEAESGRGVGLMRALVDRVHFTSVPQVGAIVHLVKELDFVPGTPASRLVPGA